MSSRQVRVQLENKERGYYASLHQKVDPYDSDKIELHQALVFFRQSGLSSQILEMVLDIAASKCDYLSRDQFYVALRLISYAQNHQEISLNAILRNQPTSLPKFQIDSSQ